MSRLKINLELQKTALDRGIHEVKNSFNELKNEVAAALAGGEAVEFGKHILEAGDNLTTSAVKLDMTVEQVQILTKAAKDSGTEFEKLSGIIDKVSIAKAKALSGDAGSIKGFKDFGISEQELKATRSVDLLFGKIAEAVKAKGGENLALPLSEILGKGFGDVLPLLKSDIEGTAKEMRDLGGLMSTETAASLKVLNDEFKTIGDTLTTFFAPALLNVVLSIEEGIGKYLDFVEGITRPKEEKAPTPKDDTTRQWEAKNNTTWNNVKSWGEWIGGGLLSATGVGAPWGTDMMAHAESNWYDMGKWDLQGKAPSLADKWHKMMEEQKQKIANLTNQIKSGASAPLDVQTEFKQKNARIYSDALTKGGNMLGASYLGMGHVVSQTDLQKQGNNKLDKIHRTLEQKLDAIRDSLNKQGAPLLNINPYLF